MDAGDVGANERSTNVQRSASRGTAFARVQMNKGHLGLCEPQINPEFKQSSQHRLGNGLRTEASFAEFSKKRAKRLGLSDDEHRKIGQTYSCIRQSRRNTEAEQRNCVRESFRGFEKERDMAAGRGSLYPSSGQGRTVYLNLSGKSAAAAGSKCERATEALGKMSVKGDDETKRDHLSARESSAPEQKKAILTQKRIVRGQNKDKPTGRKDLIKSALCSKHFYGETTCQSSYKRYPNSLYSPNVRQRPIWADRVVASIGSGHWYLPFNHHSGIGTDYRINYVTENEVQDQVARRRNHHAAQNHRKLTFRSEYTAQFHQSNFS